MLILICGEEWCVKVLRGKKRYNFNMVQLNFNQPTVVNDTSKIFGKTKNKQKP